MKYEYELSECHLKGMKSTLTLGSIADSGYCQSTTSLQEPPAVVVEPSSPATASLSIAWHNINVFAKSPQAKSWFRRRGNDTTPVEDKQILKNVSGSAAPGSLLAIMGASGAGKTTLLNVLTGRSLEKFKIRGNITVNGQAVKGSQITRLSAYVQQDDLFIGNLTVREHLIFQAHLRMNKHLTKKEKLARVDDSLQELGLTKCAGTLIGIPGRVKGISGGEMKRLAFASEILMNPSLLFCDEPTSGLDSFMAQSVVSVLKEMAAGGRTIICTIHQPSSETFAMFDRLLLMADGRVAFEGQSRDAMDFFARLGMRCPLNFNPADYYIEQLAIIPGRDAECKQKIKAICDDFDKTVSSSNLTQPAEREIDNNFFSEEDDDEATKLQKFKYRTSWFQQMRLLLWRCSIVTRREKVLTFVRIFQTMVISLVIGLIYSGQKLDQNGVTNIDGALFLLLTNLTFQNAMGVVTTFCEELPVFLREHWNGMYRADSYFLSKTLAEIPIFTIQPILLIVVVYWWIGMYKDVYAFFIAILICILVGQSACSFGYMVSALSKNTQIAASIISPLIIPLLLFGGFFLNNHSVPNYLVWIKYLSWFYYANEALCANQWKDVRSISCDNPNNTCIKNGDDVLHSLNFKKENLYPNIGFLMLLIVGFRLMAYLGVLRKSRQRR